MPAGCVFGDKGPALFAGDGDRDGLLSLLAMTTSSAFRACVEAQVARKALAQSFEVGLIRSTPVPLIDGATKAELSILAKRGWSLARSLDLGDETSHAFVIPGLLAVEEASLGARMTSLSKRVGAAEASLAEIRAGIDELCFELYQLVGDDRAALVEDVDGNDDGMDRAVDAADLVSWCVGVGVGRFDVRLATGERVRPEEPDPFDPLPVCSPGMLTGDDGLPLEVPPAGYPVEVSDVLVDDPGHRLDITALVQAVFEVVFDDPDAWWADVGEALGAKRGEISSWLSKGFFDHHLKTYSKSRRKAPILWPLGTASGSYTVWLYAHRVTADSLFRVLNDVVSPKLSVERRGLSELVQDAGPNPSASERKAIDAQEKLVGELEELVGRLTAVAPLWHPDLNDGVVIVLAPLWRLFAHHKPWSKELKKHWDKLVAGEYDWAQLAMSLWPERVVPKCAEDRSLAIAHGL
ncbi:MAG: hypothetical protein WD400_00245, partial [Pontimonas sp.]